MTTLHGLSFQAQARVSINHLLMFLGYNKCHSHGALRLGLLDPVLSPRMARNIRPSEALSSPVRPHLRASMWSKRPATRNVKCKLAGRSTPDSQYSALKQELNIDEVSPTSVRMHACKCFNWWLPQI